jgi:hypothetical protein
MKRQNVGRSVAVVDGLGNEIVSFTRASELYGIPVNLLRRWRADGALNEMNGYARRGDRDFIDTALIERRLGLLRVKVKPVKQPNGRNGNSR